MIRFPRAEVVRFLVLRFDDWFLPQHEYGHLTRYISDGWDVSLS